MTRRQWNDGQEVTSQDLSQISRAAEKYIVDYALNRLLKGQTNRVFGTSFKVGFVNSSTVQVLAGVGLQQDNSQVSPEPVNRLLLRASSQNLSLDAPDGTNDRIDIIVMRAALVDTATVSRRFKDAATDVISNVNMVVQKDWQAEFQVVTGTPAGSPTAPATPAGWLKIAEVLVEDTTGLAGASGITDTRARFTMDGYDALVGSSEHATHGSLAAAIADPLVGAGSRILIETNESLAAPVTINKANLQLDFKPSVVFTKAGGTKCLVLAADGIRINGGRFTSYNSGGDIAIDIQAGADYCILIGQRFNDNDSDFVDNSGNATILANVTE